MATVHLLNVDPGDCTIIQHNSGRVTMVDICDGNIYSPPLRRAARTPTHCGQTGNFRMCNAPTNPVAYAQDLGIEDIFRFVLTHPDMDHMDGFNAMMNAFAVANYWDTGSRRPKPSPWGGAYREEDWDRYVRVRDGREPGVGSAIRRAGALFEHANQGQGCDGLHILAPDANLVNDCNMSDDINDGSYALLYRVDGNRILLPGDAHDNTWEHILRHRADHVRNSTFLLAPHHGRDSNRSYDFLDVVRPGLTLIGSAPSEHIDYDQWTRRGLNYITSNQCGNVVLTPRVGNAETGGPYLAVWVENVDFAISRGEGELRNLQGYAFLTTVSAVAETVAPVAVGLAG